MTGRPRLLDLFCKAGGAGMGYHLAGFDVTGVDHEPQPHYPFAFHQADALDYLTTHGHEYDVIHASPPCQAHSSLRTVTGRTYVDLVPATRAALLATARPYVIENVPGAPLLNPAILCGSMFGLGARCADGVYRELRRHRLFEADGLLMLPTHCRHDASAVGVYGNGPALYSPETGRRGAYQGSADESRAAMGIDWMNRDELAQAIPPAYTQFIGEQLLAALVCERAA